MKRRKKVIRPKWGFVEDPAVQDVVSPQLQRMLQCRWNFLRQDCEYIADYEKLHQSFPQLNSYMSEARKKPMHFMRVFKRAVELAEEGAFRAMLELIVKYGLRAALPSPEQKNPNVLDLLYAFEDLAGQSISPEGSLTSMQIFWRLMTGDTKSSLQKGHYPQLPVILPANWAAFSVQGGTVWVPVTEWDSKATLDAKVRLARRYLYTQTGYRRPPRAGATKPARLSGRKMQERPPTIRNGIARVPITIWDTVASIRKKVASARRLVSAETGYRRRPRVSPREGTKAHALKTAGKCTSDVAKLLGLDAGANNLPDPSRDELDSLVEEYRSKGLPEDEARRRAMYEIIEMPASRAESPRKKTDRVRSRVRRRIRRRS